MYRREAIFAILVFFAAEVHALDEAQVAETKRGINDMIMPLLASSILSIDDTANRRDLTHGLTNALDSVIPGARTGAIIGQVITEFAIAIDLSKDSKNIVEEIRQLYEGSKEQDRGLVELVAEAIASVTCSEIASGIRNGIPKESKKAAATA